ncbi:bifunctional alpha,alpha-trehalose-phosphate synthase (UDP-forming)/trehalose-phosphatase [Nannocystis sp. SCPEA4]|uniref:bifunctional alpha,alpha-trehalose-phosphate synthase (UDP-forming)/trehalose-phosphatase n=1 Tax=Nannocystis sp. SCPEA4 TaxID=2996787 RepID=UPI002271A9EF|nr:bifunctional alpha,alpha-trehalose-phosphate synthase (UDP-forming)/trehalose-phosphatase [Nannocystis sp. SCPEA4]MCY1060787.1 bifunctional alpha,alpha-trehalose-phosphate synthase (UDP-forming)/trehalose-phosphatase [Nannocystis sp. SCPEA4]
MSRLLVVSNRLPVTVGAAQGEAIVTPSMGGLSTGLRGPFERSQGLWIGWPGDLSRLDDAGRATAMKELQALRTLPVELTADELRSYYEDFANGVLWPVFHYLLDRIPLHSGGWEMYRHVNAKFAAAVAAQYRPGDTIWVHDYQLLLLPGMLREQLPGARIGFFLHIPFPASEVFRMLPWREDVLRGMLGADLIGFHTPSYARNFASAVVRLLGHEPVVDELAVAGRKVRFRAFPMGIDTETFTAPSPPQLGEFQPRPGEHLLLGVDRLDYTKGIRRRLSAVERVLTRRPDLRGKLRMLQIAVPSRESVTAYQDYRRRVEEIVGAINGRCSSLTDAPPIHYMYRGFPQEQLISLYRAASVMLVTPTRDGMNLVAKEFAAARTDGDGVLVLSEFAGAAEEMPEALHINPFDVDGMAQAIEQAVDMAEGERRSRMAGLRARVLRFDVHRWAEDFLAALADAEIGAPLEPTPLLAVGAAAEAARTAALEGRRVVMLLDYDGTLVPIAPRPELAAPDPELLRLLEKLSTKPWLSVHVLSGRPCPDVDRWLGALAIGLHAEHGMYSRIGGEWRARGAVPEDLREKVLATLERVASNTPGSHVELKAAGLAWHYRLAEREQGAHQARELRLHLRELLVGTPLEVLLGDKVVEVRPRGVHKGLIARELIRPGDFVICVGDDRTDEDLFAAAPEGAVTVKVGPGATVANSRVSDVAGTRALLRALAETL